MSPQLFPIVFGAVFTVLTSYAAGQLLLRCLRVRLRRLESLAVSYVAGAATLSLAVFGLAAIQCAQLEIFLFAGLAIMALALWRRAPVTEPDPPLALPRLWFSAVALVAGVYFTIYFLHALAPEASPDGSSYHLGLVARYLREHGFTPITTDMYASLSGGLEMLFLFAFAAGGSSAAALVHLSFLLALPVTMLCVGMRAGHQTAALVGAVLIFLCPLAAMDGVCAYNDVAVACVLFAMFAVLQIWDERPSPRLLILVGLLAGFAFSIKYTGAAGILYAGGFLTWRLFRDKRALLGGLLIVTACAALPVLPWLIKNRIFVGNPFSPFFNELFPNPYLHVSLIRKWIEMRRLWGDVAHWWQWFWLMPVRIGILGPVFLLAPLALLSATSKLGRRLLAAACLFGLPWLSNHDSRFLIPSLPFLSLALGMAVSRWRFAPWALILVHTVLSWPRVVDRYANPGAWRLPALPVEAALRKMPEQEYLTRKLGTPYLAALMVDRNTPPGARIFCPGGVPYAYSSREFIFGYQSALGNHLTDYLYTPWDANFQPVLLWDFAFKPQFAKRVRVVLETPGTQLWSVTEMRVLLGGKEIPRQPHWRLRSKPNNFDVQMAFDNSPITRWSTWEPDRAGMFLEIDFTRNELIDMVRLECPFDQFYAKFRLETSATDGTWRPIPAPPVPKRAAALPDLRRLATREMRSLGIDHLLLYKSEYGVKEVFASPSAWGLELVAHEKEAHLFRLIP